MMHHMMSIFTCLNKANISCFLMILFTDQAWLEGREFHDDDEYIDLVEQSVDYIRLLLGRLRSDDALFVFID